MGLYGTLIGTLTDFLTPLGVTVSFGEEYIIAQDKPLPAVVVVPVGGPMESPGYWQSRDPEDDGIGALATESVDLYLLSYDAVTDAPANHADAVLLLRAQVLQALWGQQSAGLKIHFDAQGRWIQSQDAAIRYGRSYVLTVKLDQSITDVQPVEATVTSVTINQSI